MPYLSTMLGKRIENADGKRLGRLNDVVATPRVKFPVVSGIMVRSGWGRRRRYFFIPWSKVTDWGPDGFVFVETTENREPGSDDIFLARDLMDKQIVDMDGHKIVRVSDIRMARSGGDLRVLGADVGVLAILRRLGMVPVAERLRSARSGIRKDRIVPFNLMSPVAPLPYDVKLNVPYREFLEIHPSDIADIIEQLDVEQREKVLALIDNPKLADVLTQILPGVRTSVAQAVGDERLADLLEIMPPDEAADILGSLARDKAQALLSLMEIEEASVVRELLGYDPETAGGRMTTEFVAIPDSMTAVETIDYLRKRGLDAETIYYVYVVDGDGHLSGVLSLRDLLSSPPEKVVSDVMLRNVVTIDLDDDQELLADRLSRYNLLALPVLDEDHVLKGIVTVDDAIDVLREESLEDFSEVSGVPFEEAPVREAMNSRRWAGTMLTFLGGILGTALFGIFKTEFVAALALVYFVPLALRAAHDVSVWSLAVAVKDISGKDLSGSRLRKVIGKEYVCTLIEALLISGLGLAVGMVWTGFRAPAYAGAAGLFVGIAFAGMLGLVVPIVIRRAKPDPAVGPERLVSVMVMAASVISFLVVSGWVVGAWR